MSLSTWPAALLCLAWWSASAPTAEPPSYPDKAHLLVVRDADGRDHPITQASDWARRREHTLASMEQVMGPLPRPTRKLPLDVNVTEIVGTPRHVRKKLTYATDDHDRVPAYLIIPREKQGKLPAVLCLHQTIGIGKAEPAGLGTSENLRYAVHLAEHGYVTLAPDYPSFGDYPFHFAHSGYQSGSMKAIANNLRAIDLLQTLPEVDPDRIGCIGHSLGGHNTMFTAVFDTRIKALVSNCGFTSFAKYYHGDLKGWTSARYMPRIASVYGSSPERIPFDFSEVVAALAPRAFLACAPLHDDNFVVSGVRDVIAAANPVYGLLKAPERLAAYYPDCAHDFPPATRRVAYAWLDRWLKETPPGGR
jgi:dienelactone hydrolase